MISVIISCLNDEANLIQTIRSLITTSTISIECIVVDDGSKIPITIPQDLIQSVKLFRNEQTVGCGRSRTNAAQYATTDYLFIIDSHTNFEEGWDQIVLRNLYQVDINNIVYFPLRTSTTWNKANYKFDNILYGGLIYVTNTSSLDYMGVDAVFSPDITPNCLVASYIIRKDYFLKLRGLSDVKMWGSDETVLSLKILLTGGQITRISNFTLTHVDTTPTKNRKMDAIFYNKIRAAQTLMDDKSYTAFQKDVEAVMENNIKAANLRNDGVQPLITTQRFIDSLQSMLAEDAAEIAEYRQYYQSIFTKTFKQLQLQSPEYRALLKQNIDYTVSLFKERIKQSELVSPAPSKRGWGNVKNTWANAQAFITSLNSRGIKASTLNILGMDNNAGERVSESTYAARRLSCFGSDNQCACEQLKYTPDNKAYCGACGCGATKLAILESETPESYTKLHYPYLECPLKRPGFSNANI